jgi:tRNA G18 (ribose-2'-O)-methylase SpoU
VRAGEAARESACRRVRGAEPLGSLLTLPAEYRYVADPAALARAGLFVAEGRIVVQRLLEDARFRVHSIAVTSSAAAALAELLGARRDVPVHECDAAQLRATTGFDFHRGCLALAWRDTREMPIDELIQARRLLAIEGVGNPDNVGGLFRAAFALGVDAVLLDPSAADPLYRKAIRTSMAATLRLPFTRAADWRGTLEALRARGHLVIALTPHPSATAIDTYRPNPSDRLVIAVGSEGHGLSAESVQTADVRLRIPIDPRADSLNVVVAAAIALQRLC